MAQVTDVKHIFSPSDASVLEGLRPAKPYESRVCNCFVFSTETRLSTLLNR
jgi:hypothetical protein